MERENEMTTLVNRAPNEADKNEFSSYEALGNHDLEYSDVTAKVRKAPGVNYAKSVVFGGLDGLNCSFVIIAGTLGGELNWSYILPFALGIVAATSCSVGVAEFLSSRAHRSFVTAEKRRAVWEFHHFRPNEIKQMLARFEAQGMSKPDAELVVSKMAQYENVFINMMVGEELGVGITDSGDDYLLTDSFMLSFSFFFFGSLPLSIYFLGGLSRLDDEYTTVLAGMLIVVALFILGATKGTWSTSTFWLYAGLESLLVGTVSAAIAYGICAALSSSARSE